MILLAAGLFVSLITFDVSPSYSKVLTKMDTLEGAVKDRLLVEVASMRLPGTEEEMVSLDQIMKAPVSLNQDDPRLIQRIRAKYLFPPSTNPYSLSSANSDPSMGQSKQIRHILGDKVKEGGFFIECGALDGETRSNTLVFEKEYGWRGVLIEGDPKNFEVVRKKNRRAWAVNGCLSTSPYPNVVMFKQSFNVGKISSLETGQNKSGYAEVQCLPLYSILLALNTTTVDYFSLDVEGAELGVLRTIPWDKVNIKTLSVEFIHGVEGKEALRHYMEKLGYRMYSEVTHPGGLANDYIFVKRELMPHTEEPEEHS
ncbi:Protein Star [Chionoecetes opilio]|uniref:Protein Star n=1 Tax=Chionoecetes opilio TaxID=41210 RepID=A0A8J5CRU8_CHIOP|nr:Protein Star [Chionoecetes opilio]